MTGTSEPASYTRACARLAVAALALALALGVGVAGCGGGQASHRRGTGPFAWLRPAAPPTGWKLAGVPAGSTLAYPPSWRPIQSDPGTASVALLTGGGRIDAYLNATPKQEPETLANWSRFRPDHNRAEGSRQVHVVAVVVAAAPVELWGHQAAMLKRAVSSFVP